MKRPTTLQETNEELDLQTGCGSLPFSAVTSRNLRFLIGLCRDGWAEMSVYTYKRKIQKGDLLVLMPGQLVAVYSSSENFRLDYMIVELSLFEDVLSGIHRFSPHFYFYMREHYCITLSEEDRNRMELYWALLEDYATARDNLFRRDSVIYVLRILFLDMYSRYKLSGEKSAERSDERKEELADRFFRLLIEKYQQHKEVSFYANLLYITPKYLTSVVREVSGKSAKEWISEYAVLEIKALLEDTRLDIQEIVYRMHFANQSSLARFFRKHTGKSPMQYRKEKLAQR